MGRWAGGDAVAGLGWSGRGGGRLAGGVEQVHPLVLAVPVFEQVHGEVASAVAGDPGGDADQVAAQGGGPGSGAGAAGQGADGAQQVVADRGASQPGRVAGETAGWQVGQRAVGEISEDLFPLGVAAVCSSACRVVNEESVKIVW